MNQWNLGVIIWQKIHGVSISLEVFLEKKKNRDNGKNFSLFLSIRVLELLGFCKKTKGYLQVN
jgi:hypothetical protein